MKFSKIASDTYEKLQLGAGVFLTTFTPTTATFEDTDIFGATDGGVSFSATPTFKDLADGIDNATLNLKELKRIDSWEVKMSGTLKTIDTTVAKSLLGAGTVSTNKVTANAQLSSSDFAEGIAVTCCNFSNPCFEPQAVDCGHIDIFTYPSDQLSHDK